MSQPKSKGLSNLEVITGNVVDYEFDKEVYDRVVSIELFEHMKNYQQLMPSVAALSSPVASCSCKSSRTKTRPMTLRVVE